MRYPIAILWDSTIDIFIPDIPGATATGSAIGEVYCDAVNSAHEQLFKLQHARLPIPKPSPVEKLKEDPTYFGMAWSSVEIDLSRYGIGGDS
jgi:predicted RNase H-like HicB family nuclease